MRLRARREGVEQQSGPKASFVAVARGSLRWKPVRYALVSAVAVPCCQVVLVICHALLELSAVTSNVVAVSVSSIPSYVLNRMWVWRKRGPNHLWKEVVPFWALALAGLALSTGVVSIAAGWSDLTIVVMAANLTGFGVLWVFKYIVLDRVLFGQTTGSHPVPWKDDPR